MDRHRHFFGGRSITCAQRLLLQFLVQDLADLDVLVQQLAVFGLAGEPAGIPGPVDAETQPDRI